VGSGYLYRRFLYRQSIIKDLDDHGLPWCTDMPAEQL
jgi:hypothetical protein